MRPPVWFSMKIPTQTLSMHISKAPYALWYVKVKAERRSWFLNEPECEIWLKLFSDKIGNYFDRVN